MSNHTRNGIVAKQQRQASAQERKDAYARLSHNEKLNRAIQRGHKNTREALRLARKQA